MYTVGYLVVKVGAVKKLDFIVSTLDLKAVDDAMETQEAVDEPCPEEDCHGEEEEEEEEDDPSAPAPELPARVRRLRDAISHTRHFVSMSARPRWQVAAMDVVATCAAQLAMDKWV